MKPPGATITEQSPLLIPAVAFAAGVMAQSLLPGLWIPASAAVAACLMAMLGLRHAAWPVITALGFICAWVNDPAPHAESLTTGRMHYTAEVISATENDRSQSATVRLLTAGNDTSDAKECPHTDVVIVVPGFNPELKAGDRIEFHAAFKRIEPHTDLPDEIDPATFTARKGITVHALVTQQDLVGHDESHSLRASLSRARQWLTDRIFRSSLSADAKELLATALLGDGTHIDRTTREIYSAAGLSHILALSGLHVGIITLIIGLALWPATLWTGHNPVRALIIVLLWGYAALSGFGPSVTRAVVMASIYILAQMLQRRSVPLNSLAAATLVILIFDPHALFTAGFQLSFAAVASIILFADRLTFVSRRHRFAYTAASYIAVCVSAVMGTAVVSAFYFHTMPLYFLLPNIVSALLLPFVIGAGVVLTVIEAAGFDPVWLCDLISVLCRALSATASFVARLPGSAIEGVYFPAWTAVAYSATLISLYAWMERKNLFYATLFCIMGAATIAITAFNPAPDRIPTLYAARTTYRTDLVIDNGGRVLNIITTARGEPNAVKHRAMSRYRDFMQKRDIDSINVVTSPEFSTEGILLSGNIIRTGAGTIALVHSSQPAPQPRTDYALVCRGYRGDIADVISSFRPDSILLGADLTPGRHDRYVNECLQLGQPYLSLRESPWSLPLVN